MINQTLKDFKTQFIMLSRNGKRKKNLMDAIKGETKVRVQGSVEKEGVRMEK